MQLLGQAVKHISFGKGVITDVSTKVVTVHFPQGEKRFLYPQAFAKFLTLKDEEKQEVINEKNRRRRELAEAEQKGRSGCGSAA